MYFYRPSKCKQRHMSTEREHSARGWQKCSMMDFPHLVQEPWAAPTLLTQPPPADPPQEAVTAAGDSMCFDSSWVDKPMSA